MSNISIGDLANEISRCVGAYTEEVTEAIEKEIDGTANDVLEQTKVDAPKHKGDYVKGFKKTKIFENGRFKTVIWNKKYYRLVHLLEFGHAVVGGGRVEGKPHLRTAYESRASDLEDRIKRIIRNGG